MDGAGEYSRYGNDDDVYFVGKRALGFRIDIKSVGRLDGSFSSSFSSANESVYMFVWSYVICVRARAHTNKTRMYIIHTVKPLLLLLLCCCRFAASGFYFDISQCRQLLQLLFSYSFNCLSMCVLLL